MKSSKYLIWFFVCFGLGLAGFALAGPISSLNIFATGTVIEAPPMNQNFATVKDAVNNVTSAQITNGTIVNNDISAVAAIEDTKLNCAGDWDVLSDCDAVVDNADAMHSHSGSNLSITDTGGYYSTDTVEDALQQVGASLYGVATQGAITYVGYDFATSTSASVSIAVPPNVARNSILVEIGAYFNTGPGAGALNDMIVPLVLNVVPLSIPPGTPFPRFHVGVDFKNDHNELDVSKIIEISSVTVPSLNLAATNTLSLGTVYIQSAGSISNYWMRIDAR